MKDKLKAQHAAKRGIARMADVAKLAGVTTMTVSRALRTPELVSTETLRKIEEAVQRTGFIPNYAARSLVSKKSDVIVALFPTMMNSVFSGTIEELSRHFHSQGYHLLIGETSFDVKVEESLLSGFVGWRPAAIIVTGSEHTDRGRQLLENSGADVVELWNLPKKPFDHAVGFSNREAAYQMTCSLYDWGYRRIGFMNLHYPANDRSADRRAGYRGAMSDLGLPIARGMEIDVPFGMESGQIVVDKILAGEIQMDALLCSSDTLAVGALMAAIRAGMAVPDDLAIAGFGDVELASIVTPSLTTVRVPRAEIGQETARLTMQRLEGRYNGPQVIDCGFSIVRRESA